MTKLRVDLKNGFLEVEGEEAFVKDVYSDYKDVLGLMISRQAEVRSSTSIEAPKTEESAVDTKPRAEKKVRKASTSKGKNKESHKLIGDLNFKPEGKVSLRDFVESKNPSDSGGEVNAVVVYYLQKILGLDNITPDHVYTAYKHVERKVPTALIQSLKDAARRKGWVDVRNMNSIKVTIGGENFIEHDLPTKDKTADVK